MIFSVLCFILYTPPLVACLIFFLCLIFRIAFYPLHLSPHISYPHIPLGFYSLLPFIPLALYSIFPLAFFYVPFTPSCLLSLCGIESTSFGYSEAMSDQEKLVMKALFKAVRSQDLDKIQRLALQEGFDVNAVDEVSLQ